MLATYDIPIVILAAGSSRRFGSPKQLIPLRDKPLLAHSVENALKVCSSVFVVLGAFEQQIRPILTDYPIQILSNLHWKDGMASSIRLSVEHLEKQSKALLLALGDQPLISPNHFQKMVALWKEQRFSLVGSDYGENIGVPALFDQCFFQELKKLKGDRGAKSLIKKHAEKMGIVSCPQAKFDIDTFEQFDALRDTLQDQDFV